MVSYIQFIEGIEEKRLPLVRLTKSKNGETGTATFLFFSPSVFSFSPFSFKMITGISLIWDKKKIISTDINIIFRKGKPFLIKAIFLFKKKQEWFLFLNFMNSYSKQTGLFFSETNAFFEIEK